MQALTFTTLKQFIDMMKCLRDIPWLHEQKTLVVSTNLADDFDTEAAHRD
jgi:hypothetical protein